MDISINNSKISNSHYNNINQQVTEKLKKQESLINYYQFLKQNGALISKKVQFPVAFTNLGYSGLSAEQQIQANTLIIAIPNKLVISAMLAHQHPILKKIYSENPNLFNYKETYAGDLNSMVLFILYEKNITNSFYKQIFSATSESYSLIDWDEAEVSQLQDQYLLSKYKVVQQHYQYILSQFIELKGKYPTIFQELNLNNDKIFEKEFYYALKFCMTRRMMISNNFNSTFLVPFADFINHGEDQCRFGLFNKEYEIKGAPEKVQYRYYSQYLDFSEVFQEKVMEMDNSENDHFGYNYIWLKQNYLDEKEKKMFENINLQFYHDYKNDINYLIDAINTKIFVQEEDREVWNFNLLNIEDDDNEEEHEEFYGIQKKDIIRQKVIEEENQYIDETVKFWESTEDMTQSMIFLIQEKQSNAEKTKSKVDDQYLQSYYNLEADDDEEEELAYKKQQQKKQSQNLHKKSKSQIAQTLHDKNSQNQQQQQSKQQPQQNNDNQQNNQEQQKIEKSPKKVEEQKSSHKKTQSVLNYSIVQEEEIEITTKKYEWYNANNQNAYFCVYTNTNVPQGSQLLNHYSRSGNDDLLLFHGFSIENNQYERIQFRILMVAQSEKEFYTNIQDYVVLEFQNLENNEEMFNYKGKEYEVKNLTKPFKIKQTMLSIEFINFLRTYIYYLRKNIDQEQIDGISVPSNFEDELIILKTYKNVLNLVFDHQKIEHSKNQLQFSDISKQVFTQIYLAERTKIYQSQSFCLSNLEEIIQNYSISKQKKGNQTEFRKIYTQVINNQFGNLSVVDLFREYKKILNYLKSLNDYIINKVINNQQQQQNSQ